MASRFAEVDENGIQDLIVSSENETLEKRTNYWLNVFQKWAGAIKVEQHLDRFQKKRAKNFALDVINM